MGDRKQGETKRQHYVPRFLLRHFSPDGTHVSLVVLSSGKRIDHAKIQGQCYEDYFYGKDQIMEKSFSAEEYTISKSLGDLSVDHLSALSSDALEKLRMFAHYQRFRTLGSAESLNAMFDAFTKAAITPTLPPDGDISPEDLELVRANITGAQHQALWAAARTTPLLLDLEVKFIVADRTPGFIISDHPVVFCNQYAEHHPDFRHCLNITNLASKGLQMFLPLSPNVTLSIFDPVVYQYGSEQRRICRAGPSDVAYLNQMQVVNALKCIYFLADRMNEQTIEGLLRHRSSHRSVYTRKSMTSPIGVQPDGSTEQFIAVSGGDIRIGAKLSFVRLRELRRYKGYDRAYPPIRDPELYEFSQMYGAYIDDIVKKGVSADVELQEAQAESSDSSPEGPA